MVSSSAIFSNPIIIPIARSTIIQVSFTISANPKNNASITPMRNAHAPIMLLLFFAIMSPPFTETMNCDIALFEYSLEGFSLYNAFGKTYFGFVFVVSLFGICILTLRFSSSLICAVIRDSVIVAILSSSLRSARSVLIAPL